MSYKSINALMKHLRENGIDIRGSRHKRNLINTGYFHGYKGYRFFRNNNKRIPFISYDEIYATILYDSSLKNLFYGKIMFIETAVKNIALESIMQNSHSESVYDMFDKVINSYKNAPDDASLEQRKKFQTNKLNLQKSIQSNLASKYIKNNAIISHFYHNDKYSSVPIWALFETLTMGDLGFLLSCLTFKVRDDISKRLSINTSSDTKRELIYKFIYTLKDLRNAIAHNGVIFDARFNNNSPTNSMKSCLKLAIGLPYVNFKTIGDYVILICYYLKLLKIPKIEIKAFIREFEKIVSNYKKSVNPNISKIVIHADLESRIKILKNFI